MTVKERYKKERRRIQRFIKSAEKRGYEFVTEILPSIPKRITEASIRRLEKLTPSTLYKKSKYHDPVTGEIISGERGREKERSQSARKAAVRRKEKQNVSRETLQRKIEETERATPEPEYEGADYESNDTAFTPPQSSVLGVSQVTQTIISQFRQRASNFNPTAYQIIDNWLTNAILKYGNTAVAKMLEKGAQAGHVLSYEVLYDENKLYQFLTDFLDYIPDMEQEDKEEILQSVFNEYEEMSW